MASDTYEEHGERVRPDGGIDVDPSHPEKLSDPRWRYSREVWIKSHAGDGPTQGEDA